MPKASQEAELAAGPGLPRGCLSLRLGYLYLALDFLVPSVRLPQELSWTAKTCFVISFYATN